jgi:voltage-gated sodium channel
MGPVVELFNHPCERMRSLFLNNRFILALIVVNAAIIFALGFPLDPVLFHSLTFMDQGITVLFIVEMILKIGTYGWKGYIRDNWNRMDFLLILLSAPSLLLFAAGIDPARRGLSSGVSSHTHVQTFRSLKFIPA